MSRSCAKLQRKSWLLLRCGYTIIVSCTQPQHQGQPAIGHSYAAIPKYKDQWIRYMTQHIGNLIPDLSEELIHVLHYAIPFTLPGESAGRYTYVYNWLISNFQLSHILAWKELDAVDFSTLVTTSTINRITVGVLFSKIFFWKVLRLALIFLSSTGNGLCIS